MDYNNIKTILENKISRFLGKRFTMKRYSVTEGNNPEYEVTGVMIRYGKRVNVQVAVSADKFEPKYWQITDDDIIMRTRDIGIISLGKDVIVSDPCYDRDVWCMAKLENVKPGEWKVKAAIDTIDSWGKRCYVLELQHVDVQLGSDPVWLERFELGVDSGTMSVFDDAYYATKKRTPDQFEPDRAASEAFREECYKLTDNYAGIYRKCGKAVGVACSSGIGDGCYLLRVVELDGEIVAMKINFM